MKHRLDVRTAAALLVAFGAVIRLVHLLANRSLYIDEARLALNLGMRSYSGLFHPLALEQVAPVPFLLIEKFMAQMFGMSELALRLFPFLCGVALLPLSWGIARRMLAPRFALLALAMVVVSPALVRESNDVKQYALDAAVAAFVMLLAVKVLTEPTARRMRALAWVAPVACLFSLTAIFVAGPSLAVLAARAWRRRDPAQTGRLALGCIAAVALTLVPHILLYRVVAASQYMHEFWKGAYLSLVPFTQSSHDGLIAADAVWGLLAGGLPVAHGILELEIAVYAVTVGVIGLAAAGVSWLFATRGKSLVLVLVCPSLLVVLASVAHLYPLRARLEVFLMAPAAILVVAGVELLSRRVAHWVEPVGTVALLSLGAAVALVPRLWPYQWEELRPIVAEIARQPVEQPVYVYANAAPAWLYYTTDWSRPDSLRLRRVVMLIQYGGPAFENASQWAAGGKDEELRSTWNGRRELFGRSTGVPWRPYIDDTRRPMHSTWVRAESSRLEAETASSTWLVFSHYRGTENVLLTSLEGRRLRQQAQLADLGAAAFLYSRASDHQLSP